jgi:hypothetical protein
MELESILMKSKSICYLFLILFAGCYSKGQKQGVVKVNTSFLGADERLPPFKMSITIMYKNNLSIQEVPVINFFKDSSGEKSSVEIKHYSYLDADKNLCLNYKTFSDTAKVWKQYSNIDSVMVDGGWNFLSNKKFEYDSSINLPDTVTSGITYGRIRLYKRRNGSDMYFDLYTNCAKKNTLIKFFSENLGCPIVRVETYIKSKIFMIRELEFVSDRLSPEELRVFEAWEKNAKRKAGN